MRLLQMINNYNMALLEYLKDCQFNRREKTRIRNYLIISRQAG